MVVRSLTFETLLEEKSVRKSLSFVSRSGHRERVGSCCAVAMTSLASSKALHVGVSTWRQTTVPASSSPPSFRFAKHGHRMPLLLQARRSSLSPGAPSISMRPGGSMDSLRSFRAALRGRYRRCRILSSSIHLKTACTPGVRNDNGAM
jgi:hypothetical protein